MPDVDLKCPLCGTEYEDEDKVNACMVEHSEDAERQLHGEEESDESGQGDS